MLQSAQSSGNNDGQTTGGNQADTTYGTPPNGASPPPDGDDKNPTGDRTLNPDGEMLGKDGTSTSSKPRYNRAGVRIDVENPNPGQRPGQIHLQIGGDKYYFNVNTLEFEGLGGIKVLSLAQYPAFFKILEFRESINNGLRYLGEVPIKF